jgi:alpha-L-arabinofuranosidase
MDAARQPAQPGQPVTTIYPSQHMKCIALKNIPKLQTNYTAKIRTGMLSIALPVCLLTANAAFAQAKITVSVDQPGHPVSSGLWGIFFEDINHSTDGGIYPELVRNRSFEDSDQPDSWKLADSGDGKNRMTIDSSKPLNPFNRRCLRVSVDGSFTLENEGYWGMNIAQGDSYAFKVAARATDGFAGPLTIRLLSSAGQELAKGEVTGLTKDWKYHTLDLTAAGADPKARLQISSSGKGTLFLDMVSLNPKRTWKNHGLRPDLSEMLDAMKPSFVRFPGGCWVEGEDMAHMNHWKNTIGDLDLRTPLYNIWGYWATHSLGFHEYLQLSEDLGAAPLFCVNVGMSHHETVPLDRMGQWVQDALDAIEYANGPTNTAWGALRANNGHPSSFNLKYLEIGNENGGPDYRARWPLFHKAIKEKYPDVQLVANVWSGYPKHPSPDLIDEHYYDTPEFFMRQATRYDAYDRHGPKIFVGEYAVTKNCGAGNLRAAVGEAAFMTGIERNSDIVAMACYAPLFVNLNHRRWNPDLINFDSSRAYGLPGYYVQKMFSEHRGDVTLPVSVESPATEPTPKCGAIGVGTWKTRAEFKDLRVVSDGKVLFSSDFSQGTNGWKFLGGGHWRADNGVLRQDNEGEFIRALAGDKTWTDYTYTLKARKLAGSEGFLILFRVNSDGDKCWWNLGGWDNTSHGIEMNETITQVPGSIETDRWYDIRIEVKGRNIKCYLDGKLVHDVNQASLAGLYASATHDSKTGDLILKVVNAAADPLETDLNLKGAKQLTGSAQAIVLTSDSPTDENSLENPVKVSPKTQTLNLGGSSFRHAFPGNSVTVLRIGTQNH